MSNQLIIIENNIESCAKIHNQSSSMVRLLAVTKNQPTEAILPLLQHGHRLFGENRVQEAFAKWPSLKQKYPAIELHLIGHLQTNKAKEAVALFNVIQTLDNFKLAERLVAEEAKQEKKLEYYIEINIAKEQQKNGIYPEDFPLFYKKLQTSYPLSITGIMCIPPRESSPLTYFKHMQALANEYRLPNLSIGMSNDYQVAIECGSTMVRIGRALFNQSR